ncbi:MAG TPA: carboxypeptidase-like regulatory domain-containing protein, partial [Terracidiphilus sp.]|nr:carboxypeptidase-like regulatory domain-containing protein [Terracidiphilus sp.]
MFHTRFLSGRLLSAALAFLLLLVVPQAFAQTAVDGAIGGTVLDATGAVVPNAAVTVRNEGTNAEQTTISDASGYFRVLHLQPGSYSVTITAGGFSTYRSVNLVVQVGLLTTVDAHLAVGASAQTVEVTDAAPLVNTTSPDFAGVVDQIALHDLPQNNYRWSSFALLMPGVVNDSNGYGLLSFRGQSTLLNNVTIDGTDDNQAFFSEERGRTRAGYSTVKASIQEFQVNTSNYSVE